MISVERFVLLLIVIFLALVPGSVGKSEDNCCTSSRICPNSHVEAERVFIEGAIKMAQNKEKLGSDGEEILNPLSRMEPIMGRQLLQADSQERFAEPLRKARTDDQKALPEIGETGRHSMYVSNHSRAQMERIYLGIDLRAEQWAALFYEVLGCPDPSKYPYSQEESADQYEDRYRKLFQNAIPAYPMLARIWDMYTDVEYQPNEINQLRAELERVKLVNSNLAASEWLDKMLGGCDAAIQRGLGLYLASD